MTQIASPDVRTLRATMTGPVLVPGDEDYDWARIVWNGAVDGRPGVIAQAVNAADVRAAVLYAQQHGLEIAVRGGAHSTAGASTVDDGLVVDLSRMRSVTVDPVARRARVGGGATLGDKDVATQAHGLASTGGIVSHTGVGGIALVGGMGWLTRLSGLALDALVAAEVVTADGSVLRADENHHADLFWALRGGGGNFGVVTEFEFALQEVGPVVQFGFCFWGLEQGPEVLRLARDVVATMPDSVNIIVAGVHAPPAPFVPAQLQLQPGYAMLVAGFGAVEEHDDVMARLRSGVNPLIEMVTPMPYVQLQQLFDEANPFGLWAYDKGLQLGDLTDEVIAVITEHVPRKASPDSALFLYRLDRAYSEVSDDETAFGPGRSPRYQAFLIGATRSADGFDREADWVKAFREALQPHGLSAGTYLNAEADLNHAEVRTGYGSKLERLARIKATYDPGNVFHRNANIRPAPAG
jgi:FAD/FMN-containing dehydrogenase